MGKCYICGKPVKRGDGHTGKNAFGAFMVWHLKCPVKNNKKNDGEKSSLRNKNERD